MEIIEINPDDERLQILYEDYGYVTDHVYDMAAKSSAEGFAFDFTLVKLDNPKIKKWVEDEATFARYTEILKDWLSFSAVIDDEVAGVIFAEKRSWNNSVYIEKLHVADRLRHSGIGKKLVEVVADAARSRGFRMICLETQNTNAGAIQFYLKCGFEITGLDTKLYHEKDCEGEVAVYMAKML
jgi:ribosomal protein S18 acetylase RimI-like enzyme